MAAAVSAGSGAALVRRLDSIVWSQLLSAQLNIKVDIPDVHDTIALCVCGGICGLTLIMLLYAWCNYNYRPIRAKNLTWTSLIYLSAALWFIGDVPMNGHVRLVGVWSRCKLWVIWFRALHTFMFASMTIIRLYALDRVFIQKKPFTVWGSVIAYLIAAAVSVGYALISQFLPGDKGVMYIREWEVCSVTMPFRIAAITFQWIVWIACGFLVYRLRNIQSNFNEFYGSIAIFAVVIALLIETTISSCHFRYYSFQEKRRIAKTVMDTVATNVVVWLFIGYPVVMSIFRRRAYEQEWVDALGKDSSLYSKMDDTNEQYNSADGKTFGSADMMQATLSSDRPAPFNPHTLYADPPLVGGPRLAMNSNMQSPLQQSVFIHNGPAHPPPTPLSTELVEPLSGPRFVI